MNYINTLRFHLESIKRANKDAASNMIVEEILKQSGYPDNTPRDRCGAGPRLARDIAAQLSSNLTGADLVRVVLLLRVMKAIHQ